MNDAELDVYGAVATNVVWQTGPKADFFGATHNGYEASHGVRITRKVVFVKPHFWLVSDLVEELKRLAPPGKAG